MMTPLRGLSLLSDWSAGGFFASFSEEGGDCLIDEVLLIVCLLDRYRVRAVG